MSRITQYQQLSVTGKLLSPLLLVFLGLWTAGTIGFGYFIEKHNGRLWCDSELSTGTTFIIEIPIYQLEPEVELGVELGVERTPSQLNR